MTKGGGEFLIPGYSVIFAGNPWEGGGGYEKFCLTHLPKISCKRSCFKVEGWFIDNL